MSENVHMLWYLNNMHLLIDIYLNSRDYWSVLKKQEDI